MSTHKPQDYFPLTESSFCWPTTGRRPFRLWLTYYESSQKDFFSSPSAFFFPHQPLDDGTFALLGFMRLLHAVAITVSFHKNCPFFLDIVSLKASTSSGYHNLSLNILEPCGEECGMCIPFGVENATVSYSPYVGQLRVFVVIVIYSQ